MVCNVPLLRSSPSLEEGLHENQSNLHFHPKLFCSWVVMNIITGIAMAEGALHVHLSNQVWPQRSERCGRGRPANVACAE